MQPGCRGSHDIITVIHHEGVLVGVPVIFETDDLDPLPVHAAVDMPYDILAGVQPDEIDRVFVTHGLDPRDQRLTVLAGT